MGNTTQRYLRFIIPGLLAYFGLYFYCLGCNFCNIGWPNNLDDVLKLTSVLVLAFFYDLLPLRKWSNKPQAFHINAGIQERLKKPFESDLGSLEKIQWKDFKNIYYGLIDNDETLKLRSENIRFNGVLWTSAADLRAISAVFALLIFVSIMMDRLSFYAGFDRATLLKVGGMFILVIFASLMMSWRLTVKHRALVIDQCEFMLLHYRDTLKSHFKKLLERQNEPP